MVWTDERHKELVTYPIVYSRDVNIWYERLGSTAESMISYGGDYGASAGPDVSGTRAAWQFYNGLTRGDTGVVAGVDGDSAGATFPGSDQIRISGNRVAYVIDRSLYAYDIPSGQSIGPLADGCGDIDIDGQRIVYVKDSQRDDGTWDYDLYLYDLGTGTSSMISEEAESWSTPAVSGNLIVWTDERTGIRQVYVHDLSTHATRVVSPGAGAQSEPAVSGNRVVWTDSRGGASDIYLYDLSLDAEYRVTTDGSDQSQPDISGNRIVWSDGRSGAGDIYLGTIGGGMPHSVSAAIDSVVPNPVLVGQSGDLHRARDRFLRPRNQRIRMEGGDGCPLQRCLVLNELADRRHAHGLVPSAVLEYNLVQPGHNVGDREQPQHLGQPVDSGLREDADRRIQVGRCDRAEQRDGGTLALGCRDHVVAGLSISLNPGPTTIPPGGNVQLRLTWEPGTVGELSTSLKLSSNDPDTPTLLIPVSGNGVTDAPIAVIDHAAPNPAQLGESVTFAGHGTDAQAHEIAAYEWSEGQTVLSTAATFSISSLAQGSHTIAFRVKCASDAWSDPVTTVVVVNAPTPIATTLTLSGPSTVLSYGGSAKLTARLTTTPGAGLVGKTSSSSAPSARNGQSSGPRPPTRGAMPPGWPQA